VVELQRRLPAQLLERLRRHPRHRRRGRRVAERCERRDPGCAEPLDLVAADVGDADEVVVAVPARLAEREEVAQRAVVDWIGIGGDRSRRGLSPLDERRQPLFHPPEVGGEVGGAERLDRARAEHDVHPLREAPLDPLELVRVEGELQDRSRLRVASQLRVPRLVRERAEHGRLVDADEEVGDAAPAGEGQHALVDDLGAGAKRDLGAGGRGGEAVVLQFDLDDLTPLVPQPGEVRLLVLVALPPDQLGLRVLALRSDELAA
jgi:hypothetical protein